MLEGIALNERSRCSTLGLGQLIYNQPSCRHQRLPTRHYEHVCLNYRVTKLLRVGNTKKTDAYFADANQVQPRLIAWPQLRTLRRSRAHE